MTNELDCLPEPVRKAMTRLENYLHITIDGKHFRSEDYDTIRAELLRLARENAELRDGAAYTNALRLARDQAERAERAESELAKLRERIAGSIELRVGDPAWSDGTLAEMEGQLVSLVKLEDGE